MPSNREQQLLDQIAAVARQAGLNDDGVRVLLAIIKTEGGLGGAVGDQGNSYGPLQFHRKGQLPNYAKARGMSVDAAAEKARTDPVDAVKWAVSAYLGDTIRAGQRQGLKGAELATYAQRTGQRSVSPERAGQNYSASQTGGTQMPTPTTPTTPGTPSGGTNDQVPWEGPEFEANKRAYTEEIEGYLTALEDEKKRYEDLYNQWAGAEYTDEQANQLDLLRQRLAAVDVSIRQTHAALSSASNKAIEKTLASQQQRLKDAIEKGTRTEAQATAEFDKIMAQAQLGIEGLISGYASLRAALPQMGTQSMADAAKQMLYNWRELGVNIPDFDLPVMQFDPLDEIRKRLPPATDWKQALMGQQGGGGTDTGMAVGASSPSAPPSYSTPPGYMAGPGMPESMQPEAWRQGLLGQGGPSPTTPAMAAQTAPMSPGVTGLPPIRMGGGQPQGTGGTLGVPQTPAMPSPTQPPLGQGGRPGYTRGAPPAGPTPSPAPVMPTPTAGPAGEATMTPDQQQRLQTWRKRNPGASPEQERQVIEAIKMGMAPN